MNFTNAQYVTFQTKAGKKVGEYHSTITRAVIRASVRGWIIVEMVAV